MTKFTKMMLAGMLIGGSLPCGSAYGSTFKNEEVNIQTPRRGVPVAKKFPMAEGELITTAPEGTVTNWVVNGYSYVMSWSGVSMEENINCISQMVETEDGEIYILGILSSSQSPGWVKGTRDGDVITIPVPQRIEEILFGDVVYVYQIDVLNYIDGEPLDNFAFEVDESVNSITMTKTESGWHLDLPDNGSTILGLTCANEGEQLWSGYASIISNWSPIPWIETNAPSAPASQYAMVYDGEGRLVNVAFDANECYIQGIAGPFPKSWIKGEVTDENSIIFPSNQFLGISTGSGMEMGLFQGGIYGLVEDDGYEYMNYIPQPTAVFDYDSESKTLSMKEQAVLINTSDTVTRCLNIYWEPSLYPQPIDIETIPQKPVAVEVSAYESGWGYGSITFSMTNLNEEGYVIPTEDLYFSVRFDGKPIEVNGKAMIPFGYFDYELIRKYGSEYNVRFYDENAKEAEVELICIKADGEEFHSPVLVMNLDPSAVETIGIENRGIQYFDLTGRRIMHPEAGSMVIKVVDGHSFKVIM